MIADRPKLLLRVAIAADLIVVATAIAWLFNAEPLALLALYVGAVTVAAWKGGWRAGAVAVMLATTALIALFHNAFDESHLIAFVVDGAIATAIMEAAFFPRAGAKQAAPRTEFGKLVAVPQIDPEERDRESARRREIARSLERAAAAQLKAQRETAQSTAEGASVTPLDPNRGKRSDRSTRG